MKKNGLGQDDETLIIQGNADEPPGTLRARLICIDESLDESLKGLKIALVDTEQTIGRDEDNSVYIDYKRISRRHARVFLSEHDWFIEDLNSTNGVFVNDKRVERARLNHGDTVRIGPIGFRYTLDRPASLATTAHHQSDISHLGAGGTMYAGHAGVLSSLASLKESEPGLAPPRAPAAAAARDTGIPSEAPRKISSLRYVLVVLLGIALSGAGYLYIQHLRDQEVDALVRTYSTSFQKFIDNYEGESGHFSKQSNALELAEIRKIATRVEDSIKKYPSSVELKDLRARLIFLAFERQLQALLAEQSIEPAAELVEQTRRGLSTAGASKLDQVAAEKEVNSLLDLAAIVVKFKAFRHSFPDPGSSASARPGEPEMREMQGLKDQLVKQRRETHLLLSVKFPYFQRLVADVDEHDLRLVNRWRETLKPATQ